jgi:hypothetical protein
MGKERAMAVIWPASDVLESRRRALQALDALVRDELLAAARTWDAGDDMSVVRTEYPCVYSRTPAIGGHWTLFATSLTERTHVITTASVALEFQLATPVNFWVSGVHDVAAGACTRAALREALLQCDGPLRQVTPLTMSWWSFSGSPLPEHRVAARVPLSAN